MRFLLNANVVDMSILYYYSMFRIATINIYRIITNKEHFLKNHESVINK